MISSLTMDQLHGSNSEDNNAEQSRNKSNKIRPRVITKFTKRPPLQISTKGNILDQDSMTAVSTDTSCSRKEPSVYSNKPVFIDPPNISQTSAQTNCLQTRLAKLESSFSAKINILEEHNSNNENSQIDNLTPANKRLALLLKKLRQKNVESAKASQSVQERQESNNCSELENGSYVNNQAASTDFISLVDHKSQAKTQTWSLSNTIWPSDIHTNPKEIIPSLSHDDSLILTYIYTGLLCSSRVFINATQENKLSNTPNDWSLSPKIWHKEKMQPTNTPYSASPQAAEPSNQYSYYYQTNSTPHSPATTEALSQVHNKADNYAKTPEYQGRLAQILQKLRNSSSVNKYLASTTLPESSVSSSSNTD